MRGLVGIYLPAVEVRHYKGQASRQRSTRTTIEFYRAMLTFYRKHQATTNPWILNAFVVGGSCCVVSLPCSAMGSAQGTSGVSRDPAVRTSAPSVDDRAGIAIGRVAAPHRAWPEGPAGEVGPIVFLVGLILLVYWKLVFTGLVAGGYDTQTYFYPYRHEATLALTHGRLPLWNSYLFLGAPFMANIQAAVFYPLNVLYLLLPTEYALNASVVLHVAMAAIFTYAFCRVALGLGRLPALVAGAAFAFSGFMGAQAGHVNQISAAAWLPCLLLCLDRAIARRSVRWVAIGAFVVALQFLAGHTQESYMNLVTAGLFALFRLWLPGDGVATRGFDRAWAAIAAAATVAIGGAMAMVQLLPRSELGESIRAGGLTFAEATSFSLRPWELPLDLLPGFVQKSLQ